MSELDNKKPLYVAFGTGHIACSNSKYFRRVLTPVTDAPTRI